MRVVNIIHLLLMIKSYGTEFYSSVYHMEFLVRTEKYMIDALEHYIAAEEKLLQSLKIRLQDLKIQHAPAQSPTDYLSNPINEYLLIKRLFMEWKQIEQDIVLGPIKHFKDGYAYHEENKLFPTINDLAGAAEGIFRLQGTYDIDAKSFAKGKFSGLTGDVQMVARDCFDIGLQAYHGKNYNRSTEWLLESYRRCQEEDRPDVHWVGLLDTLSHSLFLTGRIEEALEFTNELLEFVPDYEKAQVNKEKYQNILQSDNSIPGYRFTEIEGKILEDPFKYGVHEHVRYTQVCRGEKQLPLTEQAKLKCYFKQETHPVLKIAPIKVEELHLKPYVVVFHGVLYDNEIKQMINVSKHVLYRSKVVGSSYGESMVEEYRVSMSTGINSEIYPFLHKVDKRIEIMTGLSTATSEGHQVANYGIGGHYEPHLDFSSKFGDTPLELLETYGNRIATLVFYLTDVTEGGSTAFPYLNIKATPRKGSALFWYNLYKDGEGNYLTRHAACPVLVGNKWSDNVWLRERGQEFTRPCGLEPDHESDEVWTSLLGN